MRIIHPLRSVSEGKNVCATSLLGEKNERKVLGASRKALQQLSTNMPPTQNNFEALVKVDLPSAWTLSESTDQSMCPQTYIGMHMFWANMCQDQTVSFRHFLSKFLLRVLT